jgi:stage V sporulation protein D (sporulation-specific penicillin-binding protein)
VTILVVLDSPVGAHHGGEVGGPVFKRVAEQVLTYLDVPRDVPSTSEVQTAKKSERAQPGEISTDTGNSNGADEARNESSAEIDQDASKPSAPTIAFGNQEAVMVPNLAGQTVRSVTEACSRLGLIPALIGSGVALEQSVEAGTQVARGTRLTVRFGKAGRLMSASVKGAGN